MISLNLLNLLEWRLLFVMLSVCDLLSTWLHRFTDLARTTGSALITSEKKQLSVSKSIFFQVFYSKLEAREKILIRH